MSSSFTRSLAPADLRNSAIPWRIILWFPHRARFWLATELLARGTHEQEGVGSLILLDIGGATTDIHSALPDLEDLAIEERGLVID